MNLRDLSIVTFRVAGIFLLYHGAELVFGVLSTRHSMNAALPSGFSVALTRQTWHVIAFGAATLTAGGILLLIPGRVFDVLNRFEIKRTPRNTGPRCPRCDYNLTGNASGRCPECGETIGAPPPVVPRVTLRDSDMNLPPRGG